MSKALSSNLSGNPLFIMLMFVLVIIIFLAIFRSVSPFLTMGLGLNAHIGSLRGSFQIEAFENEKSSKACFQYTEYNGGRSSDDFKEYVSQITGVLDVAPDNAAPVNFSN